MSMQLGIMEQTISKRLHEMGKIQKEGKWIPHTYSNQEKSASGNVSFSSQ